MKKIYDQSEINDEMISWISTKAKQRKKRFILSHFALLIL